MADVKWIKITTDIFDDEKVLMIESMPSADSIIVIWFKLLTFAGKQNNDGVFLMSNRIAYTDEMLASIFRRDVNTIRLALKAFEQFGMIEIVDNVITIPNWNKHQTLDAYEKKKQRDRLYQAERRANQRALIAQSSDTSSDASSDVVVSEEDKEKEKEEEIEKDNKRTKKKSKEPKTYCDDSLLNEAILAFIEFRKASKKPMTDHAVRLLITKLNGMTQCIPEQIEIINQSIVNGWQGVFPLKNQQAQVVSRTYHKQTKADELSDFYAMAAQFGAGD
jgi:predicted phage replisome organizer